jgi:hypothetical protein
MKLAPASDTEYFADSVAVRIVAHHVFGVTPFNSPLDIGAGIGRKMKCGKLRRGARGCATTLGRPTASRAL